MGKIQDAITKLNRKVRPSATLAAQLRVPARQQHGNAQLPVDPASLKTWLATQNFANKGFTGGNSGHNGTDNSAAAAKSLLRALQHNNRTINPPDQRLLIMEQFEKPFAVAMQALDTQYLYFDFPLQAHAEKSFQLAVTLCQEMAYGYKAVLVDSAQSDGIFSREKTGKADKIQAITTALEHLSQMALRHSQVYRDWPEELWLDINTLAGMAIHDGIAESRPGNGKKNNTACRAPEPTIINQYARLCALQIIDRRQYQPDQLRTLFLQLTKHAGKVLFHGKPQQTEGRQYSVGDDRPPVLNEFRYQRKYGAGLQYFSLDALLGKIDSIEEKSAESSIHHQIKRSRCESRAPRSGMITAESGLKEIHTLIKLSPPTGKTESQFTNIHQLLQLDSTQGLPAQSDVLNSINTTDFGSTFVVENESANGFGLKWAGTASCKLQPGEILAHCYRGKDNETSWHLSVVRWLNTDADNTLRFGVESITRHANAVDVVRLIKGEQQIEEPVEGLLANYQPIDSKAKMLILPMQKYRAGETVGYRDHNGFQLVKLIEKVNLAGNFQCFAISTVEQQQIHRDTTRKAGVAVAEAVDYLAAV